MSIKFTDANKLALTLLVLIVSFFGMSWLAYASPQKYTSPDENINLYFINLYSKTGKLKYYEKYNEYTLGHAHPRNAYANKNYVVPGGFSGFYIVAGTIGSIVPLLIPYVTPILALLGIAFIFLLSRLVFNEKTAYFAAILALTMAPFWYWSSLTLFNNIAATVFFIGGITFAFYAIYKKSIGYYFLTGLFLGLDCFVRLTDITFIIAFLPIFYICRKEINFKYFLIAVLSFITSIFPALLLNKQLYGGILNSGYAFTLTPTLPIYKLHALAHKFSTYFLPSGIHPEKILINSKSYLLFFGPLIFGMALLSVISYRKNVKARSLSILTATTLLWILIYYGSGQFWGNQGFTMDSSYVRYFLPIFLLITPLAASQLIKLSNRLAIMTTLVFILYSLHLAYYAPNGLVQMRDRRISLAEGSNTVMKQFEPNAIIFTTLSDKYLFPERKVVIFGPGYNDGTFSYSRLASMTINIKEKTGNPVYILNDRDDLNLDLVNKLLEKKGHKLDKTSLDFSYKVV
jgi:hypothetical protein